MLMRVGIVTFLFDSFHLAMISLNFVEFQYHKFSKITATQSFRQAQPGLPKTKSENLFKYERRIVSNFVKVCTKMKHAYLKS